MAVRRPAPKTPAAAAPVPKAAAPAPAVSAPAPAMAAPPAPAPAPVPPAPTKPATAATAGIDATIRDAAAKSLEQGRAAFDRLKEAAEETTHTVEASLAASTKGATDLAAKAFENAKANANATFDHLKALAGAKSLADAVSMHGHFLRTQAEAAVSQAKDFAELAKKTASESSAPIQAHLKKSLTKKA